MPSNKMHPARIAALHSGLSKYTTGEECNRGHWSERLSKSGRCASCVKEDMSKYIKKHPITLNTSCNIEHKAKSNHPERINGSRLYLMGRLAV